MSATTPAVRLRTRSRRSSRSRASRTAAPTARPSPSPSRRSTLAAASRWVSRPRPSTLRPSRAARQRRLPGSTRWWSRRSTVRATPHVTPGTSRSPRPPPRIVTKVNIRGKSRIHTAVAASSMAFETSEYVVVATGYDWPDALGGSALAGALDAPILLTYQKSLPGEVAAEIARLRRQEGDRPRWPCSGVAAPWRTSSRSSWARATWSGSPVPTATRPRTRWQRARSPCSGRRTTAPPSSPRERTSPTPSAPRHSPQPRAGRSTSPTRAGAMMPDSSPR